eukprot:1506095-Rhodomonas_salina.1
MAALSLAELAALRYMPTRCSVLTWGICYARATRCPVLTPRMLLPECTGARAYWRRKSSDPHVRSPSLRAPCAMSGTDIAYAASTQRRLLAAYAPPVPCPVLM